MKIKARTMYEVEKSILNRLDQGMRSEHIHSPMRKLIQSIACELSDTEQRIKMALEGEN